MLTVVTATMTCSLYLTCIFPQECTKSSFLFFRITKAHPFSKDTQRTFFASVEALTQGFMKAKQALYRQAAAGVQVKGPRWTLPSSPSSHRDCTTHVLQTYILWFCDYRHCSL